MKRDLLRHLLANRAAGRATGFLTDLVGGDQALLDGAAAVGPLRLSAEEIETAGRALRQERSGLLPFAGRQIFLEALLPPPRLILVGAVHIAQALAPMAAMAGYRVTVVDPRRAFATDSRFPAIALSTEWPDEAMARLKPDAATAVVTLTHDPKIDDPALIAALRSEAFYIGALGSKKTHAARLQRLADAGFDAAACARIHGPVGLPIGALTPAEIALSALAQITEQRRSGVKDGQKESAA